MSLGVDPHPLRRQPLNMPSTLSVFDTHPGTPSHEDDENAPLLRPGDVERAAYSAARKSSNSDCCILIVLFTFQVSQTLTLSLTF